MGRRGTRGTRKPKSLEKRIAYQLIKRETKAGERMYEMLDRLVDKHHHDDLYNSNARIVLAWAKSWKADVDGIKTLGKCRKASDLDRELMPYDFVILLSEAWWEAPEVKDEHREALLDHELTHATVRLDREGEPMVDERGRRVFRTRKHDLQEFSEVVRRHGVWKKDIQDFYSALKASKHQQLSLLKPAPASKGSEAAGQAKPVDPGAKGH